MIRNSNEPNVILAMTNGDWQRFIAGIKECSQPTMG
jgi:hypothetical protein